MQFDLTDDQRAIQEVARRFTASDITPHAARWDEHHIFPVETIRAAAALGFGAIYVSEASGGIGLGRIEAALIMEAMAYGCPSTSAFISIHNMAAWMIDAFASAGLKARYLPALVPMDKIASYCLTEPGSGSDAAALKTRAVATADDSGRADEFLDRCGPSSAWLVKIRTAEVRGQVRKRVALGTFDERVCTCVSLRLDRAVPVEPGLRIRLISEDDPTLTASAVVRPWGG